MADYTKHKNMAKCKPFIKWVGGKSQLIEQLEFRLPNDFNAWNDVTYIEPFVGGGAMLFHMLQRFPCITKAVINDINPDLITCYRTVRDNPRQLVESLKYIEDEYYSLNNDDDRKEFFLSVREKYNTKELDDVDNSTNFIFLNRTCFNGLYRVNKSGMFNVPFGRYADPTICDPDTIIKDSELLQGVEILNGDFESTIEYASGNTLFYFDPPYRPLSDTSAFKEYSKDGFNDLEQVRLKNYCYTINTAGFSFMLSNSDCKGENGNDGFFDVLYSNYDIVRVLASRSINSNPAKRGKLTEILVRNFV